MYKQMFMPEYNYTRGRLVRAIETGPGYPTTADQGSMFCSEPSVVPCPCEVCFVAEIEALKCKALALALK